MLRNCSLKVGYNNAFHINTLTELFKYNIKISYLDYIEMLTLSTKNVNDFFFGYFIFISPIENCAKKLYKQAIFKMFMFRV